ncbi:MAG: helix-hairpin-helix domain-containing protein [Bacteroidales bacterium]|nr:helix-hairpin-helix domain-containing protein [Bacteroidales bacterium]
MLRKLFKEYFNFTKKEQRGIFVLIVLITLVILARIFLPFLIGRPTYDYSLFDQQIKDFKNADFKTETIEMPELSNNIYEIESKPEIFSFDPNTVSKEDLLRLGLSEYSAENLIKYREKGGGFKNTEDIKKIYGISDDQFLRLEPNIKIINSNTNNSEPILERNYNHTNNLPALIIVDINHTDSAGLKKLYGIGSVLADRIIKYRDLLGGFNNSEQLKEVYGINEELYLQISENIFVDTLAVQKISLNNSEYDQLAKHPYLNRYQAKAIVSYRRIIGKFNSLTDLEKNSLVPHEVFVKVEPYLEL